MKPTRIGLELGDGDGGGDPGAMSTDTSVGAARDARWTSRCCCGAPFAPALTLTVTIPFPPAQVADP